MAATVEVRTCEGCGTELPPKPPGMGGTQRKWCGERCRKAHYAPECVDCGTALSGSDGRGPNAPVRCPRCQSASVTVWTPEKILDAARRWREMTGRWPITTDWNPALIVDPERRALAKQLRAQTGPWPTVFKTQKVFGSWNAFIVQAGGAPQGTGPRIGTRAAVRELRGLLGRLTS